jgi:hypothetical protein
MFRKLLLESIHINESVIAIFHPSWVHYRRHLSVSAVLFVLLIFLWYPMWGFGFWGGIVWCAGLLFVAFLSIRIWIIRSLTAGILTNKRFIDIDRAGLFETHVAECPLEYIHEIRYNTKGIFPTLFRLGTVIIETVGSRARIELQGVPSPEFVKDRILQTQHQLNKRLQKKQA